MLSLVLIIKPLSVETTVASTIFIVGLTINVATNLLAGFSKRSIGDSTCSTMPSRISIM